MLSVGCSNEEAHWSQQKTAGEASAGGTRTVGGGEARAEFSLGSDGVHLGVGGTQDTP